MVRIGCITISETFHESCSTKRTSSYGVAMFRNRQIILILFVITVGEYLTKRSDAFCDIGIIEESMNEKTRVQISSSCCGTRKLHERFNRTLYACLETCFTTDSCTYLYFDEVKWHCILFDIEQSSILNNYGFIVEAVDPSSFLAKFNRKVYIQLV